MNLTARFRRLTFWNKLAALGSLASLVAIPLAVALWWLSSQPVRDAVWDNAFDEEPTSATADVFASRTFWLLREPGASLTLGPCPGPRCYRFSLGELSRQGDAMLQKIDIAGDGFGIRRTPRTLRIGARLNNELGGASMTVVRSTGDVWITMELKPANAFEISTEMADIRFSIVDTRLEALRLQVDLRPGSYKPMPHPGPPR